MPGPQRVARKQQHNLLPYARPSRSPSPPQEMPPMPTSIHELDNDQSPLPTNARQLTRMTAMFWSPRAVLNAGAELRRAIDNDSEAVVRAAASKAQRLNFELCDELDRLQPDLFDLLATKDGHFMRRVRDKLSEGLSGAKAEDNNKIKHAIVHWKEWSPSLLNEPKSNRGLNHPECAYLLSPIIVNWENDEDRRQFLECSNPPMVASHWPRLLYPDGNGNRERPSEGLLQNPLLIKTAKAILRSPSSVLPSTSARPGSIRRGRKGIATKYQLSQVTPAFIAYVAVMARYALSSEESFDDDGGTFNYIEFYSQLREYLEAPKYRRRAKILIDWWNENLFPDSLQGNGSADGLEQVSSGTLSLLEAEVEGDEESDVDD